jgi:hypothetical protein
MASGIMVNTVKAELDLEALVTTRKFSYSFGRDTGPITGFPFCGRWGVSQRPMTNPEQQFSLNCRGSMG